MFPFFKRAVYLSYGNAEDHKVATTLGPDGWAGTVSCVCNDQNLDPAMFLGGDTGPMHLAAALGVPVVGIFGPTDPDRNGPFGTRSIVLRGSSSTTSYRHVAQADEGLLEVSAAQVIAASRQLLEVRRG